MTIGAQKFRLKELKLPGELFRIEGKREGWAIGGLMPRVQLESREIIDGLLI